MRLNREIEGRKGVTDEKVIPDGNVSPGCKAVIAAEVAVLRG